MGEEEDEGCGEGVEVLAANSAELSLGRGPKQRREESSELEYLLSLVVAERDGFNVTIDNSTTSEGRGYMIMIEGRDYERSEVWKR
jgi:hypothetical protein